MEKSERQIRAERLADRFGTSFREPIVFEFSGSPKAGKTTVLNAVGAFLRRCGFKVEIVVERAAVCPIRDKRHFHFNVWTACTSLTQMLERTQAVPRPDDPHIVILDRGILDSICWMRMMMRLSRLSPEHLTILEEFLLLEEWRKRLAGVIVMTAKPSDSMEREKGHLPVLDRHGQPVTGSIMNPDILGLYADVVSDATVQLRNRFPVFTVNTSEPPCANDIAHTCETVADILLERIDMQVQERILFKPKEEVLGGMSTSSDWFDRDAACELVRRFQERPQFEQRAQVEQTEEWIQPLPIAVIRDASGRVLRLQRREKEAGHALHEKFVLWAGGHALEEDGAGEGALIQCLVRELDEELRIKVRPEQLRLVGAIYSPDAGRKSAQHLAIVYEWIAPDENVAIVLNAEEFMERRGNSQSGRFADVRTIVENMHETDGLPAPMAAEPWTLAIVRHFLAQDRSL